MNKGTGFQDSNPCNKHDNDISKLPYIHAGKIERFYTQKEITTKINLTKFRRFGTIKAYTAPHLLIKQGQSNKKFCSSYLDFDCSFKSTVFGISTELKHSNKLNLLSAFLNSSISSYIMFLTTASWGIEREEVKPNEVLDLPDLCFSLPEDKKDEIVKCIDEIIAIKKQNLLFQNTAEIEKKIDSLFYEALNLLPNEIILIEDLINLTLDGFQNKKDSIAFRPTQAKEMQTYCEFLCQGLNSFLKFGSPLTSWAIVFPVSSKMPLNIIALRLNKEQVAGFIEESSNYDIAIIIKEIEDYTYQKYAESIYYRKFVKYYSGDTIYIIKPNEKRFWSRSLALNDADEIIAEIISNKH